MLPCLSNPESESGSRIHFRALARLRQEPNLHMTDNNRLCNLDGMRPLLRHVPQLHRLAVFDAVVATGGFTAAAHELGISQPAVSRHMSALSRELGFEVFERSGRSFVPTTNGQLLADAVSTSLGSLERTVVELVEQRDAFVFAVQPAMATTWVVPLLDQLEEAAGIEIRLQIFDRRSELDSNGWDLAIVPGSGEWPDWEATPLFYEAVQPLAAPKLAQDSGLGPDSLPDDLLSANLLHIDDIERPSMTWPQWFAEAGATDQPGAPRMVYNAYPTVVQEAIAGNGVVLGWRHLLSGLVERGLLVPVGPVVARENSGQYLCWRVGAGSDRHRAVLGRLEEEMFGSSTKTS